MENYFDRVFSIACFEHIGCLGQALDRMYAALKNGGILFTIFSPIWSGPTGHHIPVTKDRSGNVFNKNRSPIPPWGHLLFSQPEMERLLLKKTDKDTAYKLIHHIYQSPNINRLFTEDYLQYFQQSDFTISKIELISVIHIPKQVQQNLENRYPGKHFFANKGIMAILIK